MEVIASLANAVVIISVFLLIIVQESTQEPEADLSLGDWKLCPNFYYISKKELRYESVLVTEGPASYHPKQWAIPTICTFVVKSVYLKGGVVAVIQKLHLRRNFTTDECIDYIEFRGNNKVASKRHCGFIDARLNMNYDMENATDSVFAQYFPISYSNTFIDMDGELDVIIYIAREPLAVNEKTEFKIVFTSFEKNCSKFDHSSYYLTSRECEGHHSPKICINKEYFGDGYINCPHFGCVDEGGCFIRMKPGEKVSAGNPVITASVLAMFVFVLIILWTFKRYKVLCWAEQFAYPSARLKNNRNARLLQMNEQTGARLAETEAATVQPQIILHVQPSAPIPEQDKNLLPSYNSLFPDTAKPSA